MALATLCRLPSSYQVNPDAPGLECLLVIIGALGCSLLYSFTRSIPNRLAILSPLMPLRLNPAIRRKSDCCASGDLPLSFTNNSQCFILSSFLGLLKFIYTIAASAVD